MLEGNREVKGKKNYKLFSSVITEDNVGHIFMPEQLFSGNISEELSQR